MSLRSCHSTRGLDHGGRPGDLDEVVPALARPRQLVGARDGLDEDAGGIGGDADRQFSWHQS